MSMTAAQFVPAVFLKATGKINTFTTGSPKWLKILALGNLYIDQWMDEPGIDWMSLYNPNFPIGTVTASQSYSIPIGTTLRKLSNQETDVVRILHLNSTAFSDYDIIQADRVKDFANKMPTFQDMYVSLPAGNILQFNRAFTANDPQFGGTITIPGYNYASHLTYDTDLVPVDIPNWLVFATAAEYIRTDVTRQPQYGNIIQEANQIMSVMKMNNDGQNTRILQPWRPLGENLLEQAWTG
ncbi:MAG: hypothetical protein NVS1B10_04560 [Candidatus Saccharimonadales bacterium]